MVKSQPRLLALTERKLLLLCTAQLNLRNLTVLIPLLLLRMEVSGIRWQAELGREDFTRIPGGLPGVETRGELLYTYGVTTRKISLATMCRVLSENPAKLYGMFPRKGVLQAGADADIVVYDPQADHLLRAEDMTSLAGYTPYEGFPIRGGIRQVWLRGRLAVEDGFVLAGPDGKYISRGKCSL